VGALSIRPLCSQLTSASTAASCLTPSSL
jgi:hypothetical protein